MEDSSLDYPERWAPVKWIEPWYEVSTLGRVRSLDRVVEHPRLGHMRRSGKVLRTWLNTSGYPCVELCANGVSSTRSVSRLMGEAFLGAGQHHEVDHVDRDRAHNVLSNLRLADEDQQRQNQGVRTNSASRLRGAYLHPKTGKWQSHITVRGKHAYLGLFDTPEAAHAAYVAAARSAFGEYASTG